MDMPEMGAYAYFDGDVEVPEERAFSYADD
jgi:hypothetical protein